MAKKKKPQDQVREYAQNIRDELRRWEYIRDNGAGERYWPDGCGLRLIRNHILYYRSLIEGICAEHGLPVPEEYSLPVPPEYDFNYMANTDRNINSLLEEEFISHIICMICDYARANGYPVTDTVKTMGQNLAEITEIATFDNWKMQENGSAGRGIHEENEGHCNRV